MQQPGGGVVRVEHVVEALEQMEDVIKRLLVLFRAMDWDKALAETVAPKPAAAQSQQVKVMYSPASGTSPEIEPLPRVPPMAMIKNNCT